MCHRGLQAPRERAHKSVQGHSCLHPWRAPAGRTPILGGKGGQHGLARRLLHAAVQRGQAQAGRGGQPRQRGRKQVHARAGQEVDDDLLARVRLRGAGIYGKRVVSC